MISKPQLSHDESAKQRGKQRWSCVLLCRVKHSLGLEKVLLHARYRMTSKQRDRQTRFDRLQIRAYAFLQSKGSLGWWIEIFQLLFQNGQILKLLVKRYGVTLILMRMPRLCRRSTEVYESHTTCGNRPEGQKTCGGFDTTIRDTHENTHKIDKRVMHIINNMYV